MRVAGCNARGKVHGGTVAGVARFVDDEALVRRLQRKKYGWQKRLIETSYEIARQLRRKPREQAVFIEIVPRRTDELAVRAEPCN